MRHLQAARGATLSSPRPEPERDTQPDEAEAPRGRRRIGALVGTALLLLTADIVSKVVIVAQLRPGERVHVIGDWLFLTLGRNSGAAFSLAEGATIVLSLVAVVVIVVIARTARRLRSSPWALSLGLLLGGAAGNLVDRLVRAPGILRGEVVDWIGILDGRFPIFNLADSGITVGAILAILLAYRGIEIDGRRPQQHTAYSDDD